MENIIFEVNEGVGIAKINRPKALNALNSACFNELDKIIEKECRELKVLILTSSTEKTFSAGADIQELNECNTLEVLAFCKLGQSVIAKLENASFISIAAVNGYALGGGLELALGCDFIYASEKARFGLPEVTLGLIPGFKGLYRITEALGKRVAKEMLYTGKIITAEEAFEMRLVNKVFQAGELMPESLQVAKAIASHPLLTLKCLKKNFNDFNGDLELFKTVFESKESKTLIQKFLKRNK